MDNYSITAIAINIYLSEAHPTKTRVAQAKAPRGLQIEAIKSIPGLENRFPPPLKCASSSGRRPVSRIHQPVN